MIFQRPQGHILIDKKALISISTVSNQIHKIRMMQKTKHENLHQKFPISLKPISVELFYSNNLQRQAYPLNITTPTYKANMIACCPSSHIRATKPLIHLSNSWQMQIYHSKLEFNNIFCWDWSQLSRLSKWNFLRLPKSYILNQTVDPMDPKTERVWPKNPRHICNIEEASYKDGSSTKKGQKWRIGIFLTERSLGHHSSTIRSLLPTKVVWL